MKKILLILLFLSLSVSYGQNYFSGQKHYCPIKDREQGELWETGFLALGYPKYWGHASSAFLKIIEKDSTNCDAYFMAGYTFRIRGMVKDAVVYYYMADSLAQHRSFEFKQNLAAASIVYGNIKLARKKYVEMTKYFESNPEGNYGIALTSTMIGDVSYGLEQMRIAFEKYQSNGIKPQDDAELLLGILLTRNSLFSESLEHFEKVDSKLRKDDNYLSHYSYSLLKVANEKSDLKMKQKAVKLFKKVKDKTGLTDEIKAEFKAAES